MQYKAVNGYGPKGAEEEKKIEELVYKFVYQ